MTTTHPFETLRTQQYISLKTFRKNGEGVATAVWFALEGGTIYVITQASAGKTKRVRGQKRVEMAPSTGNGKVIGPSINGSGRVLDVEAGAAGVQALRRKYGWMFTAFEWLWKLQRQVPVILEIVPA